MGTKLLNTLSRFLVPATVAILLSVLSSCAALTVNPALTATDLSVLTDSHKPDGSLIEVTYPCSVDGPAKRKMIVYLPVGYESDSLSYPVLYLFHGARGNERDWIIDGDVISILDSLRRNSLASDYIVVMPNMNSYDDDEDYGNSRQKAPIESFFEVDGYVEHSFMNDVVKLSDSLFRTIPDKAHRAIAGLSIGGMQAIHISAGSPEAFGQVGLFSPMSNSIIKKSPYSCFFKDLKVKLARQFIPTPPDIYSIYVGKGDILYLHVQNYHKYLTKMGYSHSYSVSRGGHDWNNWTKYAGDFLQIIFK